MRITCNGEEVEVPDGATVADVRERGPGVRATGQAEASGETDGGPDAPGAGAGGPDGSAVAVNGHVVPRAEQERTRLSAGDHVELVRAVPGG